MIQDRHKKKAVWLAICLSCTAGAEGMRQTAYQDPSPAATWTICFGETKDVKPGDRRTPDECKAMLEGRLYEFGAGVDKCTTVYLPPKRKAAATDFAYNEGTHRYCEYIAPLLNEGKTVEACDMLMHFTKAGGIEFPGLVKRRQQERTLCLDS